MCLKRFLSIRGNRYKEQKPCSYPSSPQSLSQRFGDSDSKHNYSDSNPAGQGPLSKLASYLVVETNIYSILVHDTISRRDHPLVT